MTTDEIKVVFSVLQDVYSERSFGQLALSAKLNAYEGEKRAITKTVYGVLDNDIYLEYALRKLVAKKPKKIIWVILKIGIYQLKFMAIPDYAVVSSLVDFTKVINKKELAGFVNAVLKRAITTEIELPREECKRLSVRYSYPEWFVSKCLAEYGEKTESLLNAKIDERAHIRANGFLISSAELESRLLAEKIDFDKSKVGGFFVNYSDLRRCKMDNRVYTVQSVGSNVVCSVVDASAKDTVFDCCAAPGGKSVLIAERAKSVVAADLHAHRVDLIRKYAARMGAKNVTVKQSDATIFYPEMANCFSRVLCDVPCSGFGVASSRPDIKLSRKESDISKLCETQLAILKNCSKYVAESGFLIYSTCTVLADENQNIVNAFLESNPQFTACDIELPQNMSCIRYGKFVQLLPSLDKTEGFFIAKLVRKRRA